MKQKPPVFIKTDFYNIPREPLLPFIDNTNLYKQVKRVIIWRKGCFKKRKAVL